MKKVESHPSILAIKNNVEVNATFSFSKVTTKDMLSKIKQLNPRKSGTFINIPTSLLKKVKDVDAEPLAKIWNTEIISNKKFPTRLKLADITPLFKKLENVNKKNYRPVSLLPLVSKIFERVMQEQMIVFIGDFLSPYLCGYRKGYNAQYALIAMIEKWKKSLDEGGIFAAIMMDLSKAFDTINHELLIAKLHAYGFEKSALSIVNDYLSGRYQRVKINSSFSNWSKLLSGVPQGSVLGPLLFNIYINDLFLELVNTHACNFADDTTLSVGIILKI